MSYAAVAALFVHRATLDTRQCRRSSPSALRLTSANCAFSSLSCRRAGPRRHALGISEATVRAPSPPRVFAKTGTARRADLAARYAGLQPLTR
jgi:hypothetical protein